MAAPVSFPGGGFPPQAPQGFNPALMAPPPPPPPSAAPQAPVGGGFPGADMFGPSAGPAGAPPAGGPGGAPEMPDLNALLSQLGGGPGGPGGAPGGAGAPGGMDLASILGGDPSAAGGGMPGAQQGSGGILGSIMNGGVTKYLAYFAAGAAIFLGFRALKGKGLGQSVSGLFKPLQGIKDKVLKTVGLGKKSAAPTAESLKTELDDLGKQITSVRGKVKRGTAEQSQLDDLLAKRTDLKAQQKALTGAGDDAAQVASQVDETV